MAELLNGTKDTSHFAEACLTAWPEFTGNSANLALRFTREFTRTTKIVSCVDSIWSVESQGQSSEPDFSDWLNVGEQPQFFSQKSADALSNTIQEKLDQLNTQPGSDITPSNTYAKIQ